MAVRETRQPQRGDSPSRFVPRAPLRVEEQQERVRLRLERGRAQGVAKSAYVQSAGAQGADRPEL